MNAPNTPAPPRTTPRRRWAACYRGTEPVEALGARDREDLIYDLHALGWADLQIALHTRTTSYTVGRIRDRLGLEPHRTTEVDYGA